MPIEKKGFPEDAIESDSLFVSFKTTESPQYIT